MYWTTPALGAPLDIHYGTVVVGKKMYALGGDTRVLNSLNCRVVDIYVMDTATLKWSKLEVADAGYDGEMEEEIVNDRIILFNEEEIPITYRDDENGIRYNMTHQCQNHIVIANGSKVYLWGGLRSSDIFNIVHYFDTETLKWYKPLLHGIIPAARNGHSACIIQNCMYIYGGIDSIIDYYYHRDLFMINLETMTWSSIEAQGTPPYFRDLHSATAIGDRMYIFGGHNVFGDLRNDDYQALYFNDIHYFDTTTRKWVTPVVHGQKPFPRRNHTAFAHNGYLYIFGGYNSNIDFHFQDVNRYDPKNSTWTAMTPIGLSPCARRCSCSTCGVIDDRVFIYGGAIPNDSNYSGLEDYLMSQMVNDVHVLDLNPSLIDICLVKAWEYIKENKLKIDDLNIPLLLKKQLAEFEDFEAIIKKDG